MGEGVGVGEGEGEGEGGLDGEDSGDGEGDGDGDGDGDGEADSDSEERRPRRARRRARRRLRERRGPIERYEIQATRYLKSGALGKSSDILQSTFTGKVWGGSIGTKISAMAFSVSFVSYENR